MCISKFRIPVGARYYLSTLLSGARRASVVVAGRISRRSRPRSKVKDRINSSLKKLFYEPDRNQTIQGGVGARLIAPKEGRKMWYDNAHGVYA